MDERLEKLREMSRQYCYDFPHKDRIAKVFNHGMGALTFVVLMEEEKIILVNKCLAKKKDYERIASVFPEPEYELIKIPYGYPDYYSQTIKDIYKERYEKFYKELVEPYRKQKV